MKSVKLKILLPMIIIGVLFTGLMVSQYFSMKETRQVVETMTEKDYAAVQLADELKLSVVQVQQWLTDISATRGMDGYNDGFDEAESYAKRVGEILTELKAINPEYESELQEIDREFTPYYETGKKMAQAYISGGPLMGNQTMADFDTVTTEINTSVDAFKQLSLDNVDKVVGKLNGDMQAMVISNFFAIVIVTVIILLAMVYMSGSIVRPIRLILRKLKEMANNSGDLTQKIDFKGQDEIGQLAENFNKMQESFRELIRQVIEISEATSEGMEKTREHINGTADLMRSVNSKAESISAGMEENASSVEEITAATEQVSEDVREIAKDAEKENEDSRQIRERAEKLRKSAVLSKQKAEKVHEETRQKMELALENAKEVEKINALTDAIMEIANQTNLLALNASIEAARAGEAGKGFAVVAGEINQLASNSAESVAKIRVVNENIMAAVNDMVDTLKEVYAFIGEEVMKDYEETVLTGEHYQEDAELIYSMSTEFSDLSVRILDSMDAIVENMATVAQGSEQAAGDTMDISGNISDANKDVDEITMLTNELYQRTKGLSALVEKYTV